MVIVTQDSKWENLDPSVAGEASTSNWQITELGYGWVADGVRCSEAMERVLSLSSPLESRVLSGLLSLDLYLSIAGSVQGPC